ncbi:MAG: hypothetical protein K2N24_08375, partial [Lachnospiraceae bacterium]|nr:hypothetical protein [Lachnospiraceae bacterium]
MKHKISKAMFAVVSCGLIIQAAFPMYAANAYPLTGQDCSTVDAQKEIFYFPNVRMEQVPAELLDDASAEDPAEGLEEDSTVSPQAAAAEWRITSAADWEALLNGTKSPDWSDGSYTGEDDVTIILEADIVTARDSIYLTQEDITFTLDLNKHSLRSTAGIINVNSVDDTGTKRTANSFVLCNGKIVNTCIDTSDAMKNVDIHGVNFTDMNTNAVLGNSSTGYTIHDCSFRHVNGENTHTAIEFHSSRAPVQIYNNEIDGFHNGVNCSGNTYGVALNKITVSNAYLGVDLSGSYGSKMVESDLSGNQAAGSQGVRCENFSITLHAEFLYAPVSNMSGVKISDFESGVRIDNSGTLSLDNCKITNVIHGLDGRGYNAQFNIRDSVLSANPSVAEGSYTGDSYGINATAGYCCVNTEVTGFKVGARNTSSPSSIANCTFDNLDCNVNAYYGCVYNSVLKNAAVGYYSNGSTACIVNTMITGKKQPGSIGIHQPLTGTVQNKVTVWSDTPPYSVNTNLHSEIGMLKAYVASTYPDAPHYDMCISGFETGLQCDNDRIEIVGIEVKNCGTGVKGVQYNGCSPAGPDNYIHDCDYGIDCNVMTNMGNMYIYDCSQTGMQIHNYLYSTHLVEIYNCGEGFIFDGNSLTGTHLRIYDNAGNGLSCYRGTAYGNIIATMEIYNNGGWNIYGDNNNEIHLSKDNTNEFTCRLENGGLGNMNIKQSGSSGSSYMLNMSHLKSDEGVYYVYPGKELCINPSSDGSWIEPTDWLEGSMVFDTDETNYREGAVAAYAYPTYVRTISDEEEDTWDFVRTHFFAAKEGWVIRYDMSATPVMGPPLVFAEGCNVIYDYKTNGGTSIQSDYEKITYLEGEDVDLS